MKPNAPDSVKEPIYVLGILYGWYYLIAKLVDLLDTVFFVLRKKQSHITFLHVYHHASLVFLGWASMKYIRCYQSCVIGFINAFVHVVMYIYYLLAAFGDTFRPLLLRVKAYVTKLQLAQFAFMVTYMGGLIVLDCKLPKVWNYYMLINGSLFFYLFWNFYRKTYNSDKKHWSEMPKDVKKD